MAKTEHQLSIVVWAAETLFANLSCSGRLDAEGVHGLRRASKQARAILRLAEDCGLNECAALRKEAAEAARPFSALRDAVVMRRLARRFARALKGKTQAAASRAAMRPEIEPTENWWNARWGQFRRLRRRFAAVDAPGFTVRQLRRGLRRSAQRVVKRARHARGSTKIHRLHQWRKSIVVLRDQLDVLRPMLGEENDCLHKGLCKIGRALGAMMDCEVLRHAIERGPDAHKRGNVKLLAAVKKSQRRAIDRAWKHWRRAQRDLGDAVAKAF